MAESCAAGHQQDQRIDVPWSSDAEEPRTNAVNRAKFEKLRSQMTREDLLERDDAEGQYGTYRIEGDKVTRRIVSAMDPNNEGREATSEFRVDGDVLTITGINRQGQVKEDRYRRLRL